MELKTLIEDYLREANMLQIATAMDHQPWACTVYFAFDAGFNLYWISRPSCRHSQELKKNEKIAGAIVLPHTPGDDVRGIQFQGTAKELSHEEAAEGIKCYAERYGMKPERVQAILNGTDGHACYKITPSLIVLFDEVHFPDDPRQELRI